MIILSRELHCILYNRLYSKSQVQELEISQLGLSLYVKSLEMIVTHCCGDSSHKLLIEISGVSFIVKYETRFNSQRRYDKDSCYYSPLKIINSSDYLTSFMILSREKKLKVNDIIMT